jgi:hypothetical protein
VEPTPEAHDRRVQILLDVDQAENGRLTGKAMLAGHDDGLPFSGNLELLARVEELSRRANSDQPRGDDRV